MNFISSIIAVIVNFFSSIFVSSNSEYLAKQKNRRKQNRKYEFNQWNRLFAVKDIDSLEVLKMFKDSNVWIKLTSKIKNAKFEDCYSYETIQRSVKGIDYPLFQIDSSKNIMRVNPFLYKTFQKELNKYLSKYNEENNENIK